MDEKLNEVVESVALGGHNLDCKDACFLDGTTHRQAAIRNCKFALKNIDWLVSSVEYHVERSVDFNVVITILVRRLLDAGLELTVIESERVQVA